MEKQGIKDEADLERLVYGRPSGGGGFDFPPERLSARRDQLFLEVHDALETIKLSWGAPVSYVAIAANKWFRSEASNNQSWATELSDPGYPFAGHLDTYRVPLGPVAYPGWGAGKIVWDLRISCPDPAAPKDTGKQVLFAWVVVTLTLEGRGQMKVRVTLEQEDVPGGWSETLGDRIISALKRIVDLEKRGVQVEIGYK